MRCYEGVVTLLAFILNASNYVSLASEPPAGTLLITRQNNGDVFTAQGIACSDEETCIGLSSGTATMAVSQKNPSNSCTCRCHDHLPVFREDLRICVDDIHECMLAPFVGGSTSQQIPFIFLPLKGQIIHPSKEISFTGIETPVCAVSGAKYLSDNGWVDLRNPLDTDVPFRLFRDEGRTFLQWVGEPILRTKMSGRLVLVYLMCREVTKPFTTTHSIFSPCVAFRVVGTPSNKHISNVSEVTFFPDAHSSTSEEGTASDSSSTNSSDRLSISEYVAIGICSVLLGLIYVASVLLYLHLRRRSRLDNSKDVERRPSLSGASEGVVKSNPLLGVVSQHHFHHPPDNIYSDSCSSDTDIAPDVVQNHEDRTNKTVTAMIHPSSYDSSLTSSFSGGSRLDSLHQDSSSIERLPEENVSIVETLEGREERSDALKAITGTTRKKLYFNPAYFEPQLLLAPPPAAIEFLCKIREVITIAKQKMTTKKFSPSLMGIPEEDNNYSVETGMYELSKISGSRRSSMISLKRENSRRNRTCSGCPGCEPQDFQELCGKLPEFPSLGACNSCATSSVIDNKQRSIQRWLENVPMIKDFRNTAEEDNKCIGSVLKNPKRIRSPTRSLPPTTNNNSISFRANYHISAAAYNKAASERARSPDSDIHSNHYYSITSELNHTGEAKEQKARAIIRKPRESPPPRPPKDASVINLKKKLTSNMSFPPPDMIHEAMAVDSQQENQRTLIPNTMARKNMQAVIQEISGKRQIDYEADSLERGARNENGYNTPSEYAEVSSSQPSPSLSNALPMDEELTMRNEILNKHTGNRTISKINMSEQLQTDSEDEVHDYELVVLKKGTGNVLDRLPEFLKRNSSSVNYSLVSEVYVNNGYNYGSAPSTPTDSPCNTLTRSEKLHVRYEGHPGKLLIEVADCPDNYIPVNDEDTFEPDTLDRKPTNNIKTKGDTNDKPQQILLRTSGSFRKDCNNTEEVCEGETKENGSNFKRTFGSLREIYEAKVQGLLDCHVVLKSEDGFAVVYPSTDEGRLLTLEERHSKRQRRNAVNGSGVQPDVIPPPPRDDAPIYERPKPPRNVNITSADKNIIVKPPIPPKSRNTNVPTTNADYELCLVNNGKLRQDRDLALLDSLIKSDDLIFKNSINKNHVVLHAQTITPNISTVLSHQSKTIVPSKLHQYGKGTWIPVVAEQICKPEDSGYLSTDSNESKRNCSKRISSVNTDRNRVGDGSETEESFGDGHSESGAESIETHSVFFGSFRKRPLIAVGGGISIDSGVGTEHTNNKDELSMKTDDGETDSESVSYTTVVPLDGSNVSTISSTNSLITTR